MVYKFDPAYWNGTIFLLEDWDMSRGWIEYVRENKPIPASCFPKSLTVADASQELPDMFHTARDLIVFSERARLVMEEWAPSEVEFIPVTFTAAPSLAAGLNFASAYYFLNVLGRVQRLQWLEMSMRGASAKQDCLPPPASEHDFRRWKQQKKAAFRRQELEAAIEPFSQQKDGIERYGLTIDYRKWKLRDRAEGEPLIWRESHLRIQNREYRGHTQVFVEDILWRELDANFPDQLNAQRVGEHS